ncbi:hypothetical protein [uncultured Methylibium sp.]|uniref:hypothetical protein n=1 Tax=uncultured Methylibium sp. TaxID=381093 RepID=UPI0025E9DDF4|nr:hypothetical protein [uncultured Methylibium sp.]
MSVPSPSPVKTELGQDELRRRTRKLGQRHRTVLLLVDGKRSRDEVVALAQQAGVTAGYFDELVAMGLVEVAAPAAEPEPATPPPLSAAPAPVDPVAVELAPAPPPAPLVAEALPEEEPAMAVIAAIDLPVLTPLARGEPVPDPVVPPVSAAPPPVEAVGTAEPARPAKVKFAPPKYKPKPAARVSAPAPLLPLPEAPVLTPAQRPAQRPAKRAASLPPPAPARAPAPVGDGTEEGLLSEVRSLLIGTLLVDGPVMSSLTALRVGRARTRYELIELVWQIERSLVQARRPREAQGRLIRARELLGLGNTLVDEDTSPGPHSE